MRNWVIFLLLFFGVFEGVSVEVDSLHYKTVQGDSLWLNKYTAAEGKAKNETVLFVHGGGFFMGSRNHPLNDSFCLALAQEGYQVYSVDYHLSMKGIGFGCNVAAEDKEAAILNAQIDVEDALMFLENNEMLSSKIHLMGSSAGAETVLSMVFNNPKRQYTSLVSFAGALVHKPNREITTQVPMLFIQGNKDEFVPYRTSAHRGCTTSQKGYMIMDGSYAIYHSLCDEKNTVVLITYENGPHAVCNFFFENKLEVLKFLQGEYVGCREINKTY